MNIRQYMCGYVVELDLHINSLSNLFKNKLYDHYYQYKRLQKWSITVDSTGVMCLIYVLKDKQYQQEDTKIITTLTEFQQIGDQLEKFLNRYSYYRKLMKGEIKFFSVSWFEKEEMPSILQED